MNPMDTGEANDVAINDLLSSFKGIEPAFEYDPDIYTDSAPVKTAPNKQAKQKRVRTRGATTHDKQFFRRYASERQLEEVLDWEFEQGAAYHVISGGDVDSLTFLKLILRQQPVRYLALDG